MYGYADDALDQAADELHLVLGEDDAKVITDAEAAVVLVKQLAEGNAGVVPLPVITNRRS